MRIYWVYGGRDVTRTITATGETFEHLSESDRGGLSTPMTTITTINPADGSVARELRRHGPGRDRTGPRGGRRTRPQRGAGSPVARPGGAARPTCGAPARRRRAVCRAGHLRDGQAPGPGPGRGREVRRHGRLLRRPMRRRSSLPVMSRSTLLQAFPPSSSAEPLGLVLAVMPWNFPVWQVMRFAIPTLAAGNGVLLKHSPNVTGSALALADAFVAAGFPSDLFTTLVVAEADVPATVGRLIEDDRVAAVTLTGSNRAGEMVGAAAGRASKRSVLELGGSDAFVVLADADVPGCRGRSRAVPGSPTPARAACAPSASSSRHRSPRSSPGCSSTASGRWSSATRRTRRPTSDRWPGPTCATPCSGRSTCRSLPGPPSPPAGRSLDGAGYFYAPTVLLDAGPGCRPSTRRPSARSPPWRWPPTRTTRSGWRTRRPTAWASASGAGPPERAVAVARAGHVGCRVRQRRRRLRPPGPVRRHQAQRLRPRARRRGHPRVHQPAHLLGRCRSLPFCGS